MKNCRGISFMQRSRNAWRKFVGKRHMEHALFTPEMAARSAWLITVVVIEYLLVLAATLGDMASGIRKARRRVEPTRSRALRRTIDKLARYYNVLAILTVVDAMQITAAFYLRLVEGYDMPTIPLFTLIGSLGMAFIEVKSIFENGSEKEKERVAELADLLKSVATDEKIKEIINKLKK